MIQGVVLMYYPRLRDLREDKDLTQEQLVHTNLILKSNQ